MAKEPKKVHTYTQVPLRWQSELFARSPLIPRSIGSPRYKTASVCCPPSAARCSLFRALAMCACTRRTSSHMGLGVSWARPPQPYSALGPCRRGGSPPAHLCSHQRSSSSSHTPTVGLLVYCHRSFPPNRACRRGSIFSHMPVSYSSFAILFAMSPLCSLRARSRFRPSPHSSPQGFFLPLFFSWLCSPWL